MSRACSRSEVKLGSDAHFVHEKFSCARCPELCAIPAPRSPGRPPPSPRAPLGEDKSCFTEETVPPDQNEEEICHHGQNHRSGSRVCSDRSSPGSLPAPRAMGIFYSRDPDHTYGRADGAPRERLPQLSQPAFVCRQTLHLPRQGGSLRGTRRKRPRDGRRGRMRPRGTRPLTECRRGPNTRAAPSRPRLRERRGGPGRAGGGSAAESPPGRPRTRAPRCLCCQERGEEERGGNCERGKKSAERERGGDGLPAGPQSALRRARSAVLPPSALSAAGRAAVRAGLLVSSQVVPKRVPRALGRRVSSFTCE